jgi:hypothetical protein
MASSSRDSGRGGSARHASESPRQPLYYNAKSAEISSEHVCTSFQPLGALEKGQCVENDLHDRFAEGIRICELVGAGEDLYVLWQLPDPTDKKAIRKLFPSFLSNPDQKFLHENIDILVTGGVNDVVC